MKPIEIVIDGTDWSGKTPVVEKLVTTMRDKGWLVATGAPFREVEVFPLWQTDPFIASKTVNDVVQQLYKKYSDMQLIVWDRGWPTVFVSTDCQASRNLWIPYPNLTVLLLNSEQTILNKLQQPRITGPWVTNPILRRKFLDAYYQIAKTNDALMQLHYADIDGRFVIEDIIMAIIEQLEI